MTRRERLERKMAQRQEWADKAAARSDASFGAAREIGDKIPFGQPILVGHHSEKRARRDADRIHANMERSVEEAKLARHHEAKAKGLASALDRTIFDDDPDAIERLRERIDEREAEAKQANAINAAWRRGYKQDGEEGAIAAMVATGVPEPRARQWAKVALQYTWTTRKGPCDATRSRAAIRTDKARIAAIEAARARATEAEQAPGGALITGDDYVRVTFPEKPEREVLNALRAAGFRWRGGSWCGARAALPASILPEEVA